MAPTSLLTADVMAIISGFAGQLMPTVLGLVAVVVPVGLSMWALGFGLRKGISYLQRRAKETL